jgi:outer membrane protein TolC
MQIVKKILLLAALSGLTAQAQQSYTLEHAIAYAQEHSYLAQNSSLEVDKAQRIVNKTLAIGFPQISVGAYYGYYLKQPVQLIPSEFVGGPPGGFEEFVFGTKHNINTNVTATQLLFDGSYIVGVKGSEKYLEMSKNAEVKTAVEIRDAVIQLYGAVLVAQANEKVLQETLDNLNKLVKENSILAENGFLEETDVEQLEILAANTENQLRYMQRYIYQGLGALKLSMGVDMAVDIELTDNLESLVAWVSAAQMLDKGFDYNFHIDYVIANNQRDIKALQVSLEKAKYLPRLDAFINFQENAFSQTFSNAMWFPASLAGVNFSMPIFTSFQNRNSVQESLIALDQANVSRKQTEQQLILNAENARNDYMLAYDLYTTKKRSWQLSKNINDREFRKYQEGMSSSLNILQTQNQYLQSQTEYTQAIFQLVQAKSALEKALNTVK